METLTLNIPTLYGDHHTSAVQRILQGLEGVSSSFITAAFRQVQVEFDPQKIKAEAISTALSEQGYSEDAPELTYPQTLGKRITRHTATHSGTGETLSFQQTIPTWESRPLWPCPGFDPKSMDN